MKKKIYKKSKTPGDKLNRYPNIQIYRRQIQMKNSGTNVTIFKFVGDK